MAAARSRSESVPDCQKKWLQMKLSSLLITF